MSGVGVGVDLGPRASAGWRLALDPRDPERLEMRRSAPDFVRLLAIAAIGGTAWLFVTTESTPWLAAIAMLAAGPLIVRRRLVLDRHAGCVERGLALLLELGADPDARDCADLTPLHCCMRDATRRRATLLIEHGADPNAAETNGMTPLHVAAEIGSAALVNLLVARGAHVNAVGPEGNTALHRAVGTSLGDPSATIQALADAGIDPSIRDMRNRTARDLAREYGWTERLRDLLVFESGAPLGEEP